MQRLFQMGARPETPDPRIEMDCNLMLPSPAVKQELFVFQAQYRDFYRPRPSTRESG
jgi:hypothetical protein